LSSLLAEGRRKEVGGVRKRKINAKARQQLVVGATLTGLGPAAGDHPQAITVLGAVNTGVAGLLGLLKGNGLPDRLRKDGFELRKVLDYIEEVCSTCLNKAKPKGRKIH